MKYKKTLECPDAPAWWYPLGLVFIILILAGMIAMPTYFFAKFFLFN